MDFPPGRSRSQAHSPVNKACAIRCKMGRDFFDDLKIQDLAFNDTQTGLLANRRLHGQPV